MSEILDRARIFAEGFGDSERSCYENQCMIEEIVDALAATEARAKRLAAIVRAEVQELRASEMEEGRPEQECVSIDSICSMFGCPIEQGDLEDGA